MRAVIPSGTTGAGEGVRIVPFDAFISYSHTADRELAPALQTGLHRLAKPWYRMRALRVIRDETDLTVHPDLRTAIQERMNEAEWLILLASESAAQSAYVDDEVAHWLAQKGKDRLLLAVTSGTVAWDRARGDWDPDLTTALPPSLYGLFADEPRYQDLRWTRESPDLTLRNPEFRAAVADLAAPIRGVDKETLISEDRKLHRRARRLATFAVILTILLASGVSVAAAQAWRNARAAQRATEAADQAERRKAEAERLQAEAEAAAEAAAAAREQAEQLKAEAEAAREAADAAASQAEVARQEAEARRLEAIAAQAAAEDAADAAEAARDDAEDRERDARAAAARADAAAEAARTAQDVAERLTAEARAARDAAARELALAVGELATAERQLDVIAKDLTDAKNELADSRSELETTQAELTDTRKTLTDAEKELVITRRVLATAEREVANARKALETARNDLNRLLSQLERARRELEDAKDELDRARRELARIQGDLEVAKKDLETARDEQRRAVLIGDAARASGQALLALSRNLDTATLLAAQSYQMLMSPSTFEPELSAGLAASTHPSPEMAGALSTAIRFQPQLEATIHDEFGIARMALSGDGSRVATATGDLEWIVLWDPHTGAFLNEIGASATSSIALNHDARLLAVGGFGGIHIWNLEDLDTGPLVLRAGEAHVTALAFSPDAGTDYLATADDLGAIRVWRLDRESGPLPTPSPFEPEPTATEPGLVAIALSPRTECGGNPCRLLAATVNHPSHIWVWPVADDASVGERRTIGTQAVLRKINGIAFSPPFDDCPFSVAASCTLLVSVGEVAVNDFGLVWDPFAPADSPPLEVFPKLHSDDGHVSEAISVAFSGAIAPCPIPRIGSTCVLMVTSSWDTTARVWYFAKPPPNQAARRLRVIGEPLRGHGLQVWSARIASATADCSDSAGVCPVVATFGGDGSVRVWDPVPGQQIGAPQPAVLEDETANDEATVVSNTCPGGLTKCTLEAQVISEFSVDVTVAEDSSFFRTLDTHTAPVWAVAISPDGDMLATAGQDRMIHVWDLTDPGFWDWSGGGPRVLAGHTNNIEDIEFGVVNPCPFGPAETCVLLASAADDSTVRLWSPHTGQPIGEPFRNHSTQVTGEIMDVDFVPGVPELHSTDINGDLRRWDISRDSWLLRACARTGRNLTQAEWDAAFPSRAYHQTCPPLVP